jgi:hypothetical protein
VHLPWPARQYERTCADCGHSWHVPRQFAKHVKPLRLSHMGTGRGGVVPYVEPADVQAYDRRVEEFKVYRTCPKCSSQHYSQRPVRS